MKNKAEHRKKGTKPPFFRNTTQGKPTLKEPIMTKIVGKKPRKQPIQCWGCGRDHMYRDFPQRGEKGRAAHIVQQVAIVEDMEKNVPRIYVALVNNQAKF
jgi:hypothetical protein